MQASARWAALAVAGVAVVALAGCRSGSSGNSTGSASGQPNIPVSTAPPTNNATSPGSSGSPGKLTGNFCTDIKNIGNDMQVPTNAEGSLSNLQTNGVKYLAKVQKEFTGLAAEAPPAVAKELRTIATDYQSIASAIASKNLGSLQKLEKQMAALTTKGAAGNAFRALISYMVTKCP
jgi:hypothetical protein